MGIHDRLVYDLIETHQGIQSGALWTAYRQVCQERNITSMAERTFLKAILRLHTANLIRYEWRFGKGRTRAFWTRDHR
jgi:Cdc6-like AAA superfamily ATPase